jgi:hypothetical protein
MLEEILLARGEGAGIHPADLGMKFRGGSRKILRIDDHVAAADVEIVLDRKSVV